MTSTIKILMILTSHAAMGDTGRTTGVWFEELAAPYYQFIDSGAEVDIASIDGGKVPIDPHSMKADGDNPASVERFQKDDKAMKKILASTKIADIAVGEYAAVFLPGGHGTMWDLPNSDALANALSKAWIDGKVVAAVCHGPAGLVKVKDANGKPIVAGRKVSAFSNAEEVAAGLDKVVPFLLESRLREIGALYESGPDFRPFAVRDGNLVTGQNPASSEEAARLTLEAVQATTE